MYESVFFFHLDRFPSAVDLKIQFSNLNIVSGFMHKNKVYTYILAVRCLY